MGEKETSRNTHRIWWAHPDSNQGPTGYEPVALPLSYGPTPRIRALYAPFRTQ